MIGAADEKQEDQRRMVVMVTPPFNRCNRLCWYIGYGQTFAVDCFANFCSGSYRDHGLDILLKPAAPRLKKSPFQKVST